MRGALCGLALLLFCAASVCAQAQDHEQQGVLLRDHLLLPVTINGVGPYSFLVDLGVQQAMLSVHVARYLGLEAQPQSVTALDPLGQPATAALVAAPAMEFTGIVVQSPSFAIVDPALLSRRLGVDVAGLLPAHQPGYEVEIEPEAGRLVWRPLEHALLQQEDDTTLPMHIDDTGTPTASVLLNTLALQELQLDLAFDGVVALPPEVLRQFDVTPQSATQLRVDALNTTQVRLRDLKLGALRVADPVCAVLPEGARGRVGLALLRHFRLILNYEHGLLRLEPLGATFFQDPPVTGLGLALHQRSANGWHLQVAVPSPAYAAGIRTGDSLTALDGVPLGTQVTEEALNEALQAAEGASHAVTVERGGEIMTVQLVSAQLL
jgi:hypothetical protein